MTTEEFSNEFDVLVGSFTSDDSLVFDEYEKSVFLTKAQEQIVTELYTGRNTMGSAFEETEELRSYLRDLIKEKEDSYLDAFTLPPDVLFIIYEEAILTSAELKECENNIPVEVIPVTHDQLHRIKNNPFKGPSKKRVLRLDIGDNNIQLISKYTVSKYKVRYIKKPEPIILVNLDEDQLSINDTDKTKQTSKLSLEALHRSILERAVLLAIASRKAK